MMLTFVARESDCVYQWKWNKSIRFVHREICEYFKIEGDKIEDMIDAHH
jgi:hypothetical protein